MSFPPLVVEMIAASKESFDNLLDSIANVTHGFTDDFQYETIEFEIVEGCGYKPGKFKGILKGENANYLFGYGYDNVIAAKVMLVGDAEKIA